ncbi:Uncharacterized protein PBTT_06196 [Plasmodiophora brassicae]
MGNAGLRILILTATLVSLSLCGEHDEQDPVHDQAFLKNVPFMDDSDLLRLACDPNAVWEVVNTARQLLHDRQQWRAMFKPGSTSDTVRQFFLAEHVLCRDSGLNDCWAASVFAGRPQIYLRDQIMFLDRLASVPNVEPCDFVSYWQRAVFRWKLPGSLALGTLIRHYAIVVHHHDDRRRFRILTALKRLLEGGATLSRRGDWGLQTPVTVPPPLVSEPVSTEISPLLELLRVHKVEDDDITIVRRIIDKTDGLLARCDNWDEHGLLMAVERGFDLNGDDPETGLKWFDMQMQNLGTAIEPIRLSTISMSIGFGLDVERAMAERTERLVRQSGASNEPLLVLLETLLINVMLVAADPTEAFVNLWGKYFHMIAVPSPVFDHVIVREQALAPERFAVTSWAHDVAVRLLRLQLPIGHLSDVRRLMDADTTLLSGIGSSILLDYDLCAHPNPLIDLNDIVGSVHLNIVRHALQRDDPISGRTILHKYCMSAAVLEWVRQRADPHWFVAALRTRTTSMESCLDYWLFEKDGSLLHDNHVIVRLRGYRRLADLEAEPLSVVVAEQCSSRTQTYLHLSDRISRAIYLFDGPAVDAITGFAETWATPHLPPGAAFAMLSCLLTSLSTAPYRRIRRHVFAAEYGAFLLEHCNVHQWTPLHFAVAIPSMHEYVPDILEAAVQTGITDSVVFARDGLGRTFLHVAAESWMHCQARPRYREAGTAFKRVIVVILQFVMKLPQPSPLAYASSLLTVRDAVDGTGWSVLQRLLVTLDSERDKKPEHDTGVLQEFVRLVGSAVNSRV